MPVYLDHNASTPLDEKVLEAMLPFLRDHFGNPSSVHRFGRLARAAIDTAREQVAELVTAHPSQVIFTSGGTESNNLALKGVAAWRTPGLIAVGATEHPSVQAAAESLVRVGGQLITLKVDRNGRIHQDEVERVMQARPALVSVMIANNETGVIQNLAPISEAVRAAGAVMHTDAVQGAGKMKLGMAASGAHLMSLSAHKMRGPKGLGALIVDKSIELQPLLHGGGHEKGRRAGTENLAGIVGFGAAAALARERLTEYETRIGGLCKRLESGLRSISGTEVLAAEAPRLPNTVCFTVRGIDGETLLMNLDKVNVALSSGSACSSGSELSSPVLQAMGADAEAARSSLRASLGWDNTEEQVDTFIHVLNAQVAQLRDSIPCVA